MCRQGHMHMLTNLYKAFCFIVLSQATVSIGSATNIKPGPQGEPCACDNSVYPPLFSYVISDVKPSVTGFLLIQVSGFALLSLSHRRPNLL
ncbi:uncharacterized protein EI90DRAFT_3091780 [Cantharellus anzutake]|uniref:uncharacterized protein n=1 Tax=Cantharellus anzutake TaxID=1750568 RepID=UPI0019066EE2|nr:uncharacterized protein EI90DRAFT_3091780 [Cantharellus anzutake]KAF8313542.1 hypothetical protein EI90DRAFT_3091780 [Cantharellus anzutake]